MSYRIEISSVAEGEADSAFLRISQITSSDTNLLFDYDKRDPP